MLPKKRIRGSNIESGVTLLELIIASSLLLILATAALPVFKFTIIRSKEYQLRRNLREIRNAIDRYKNLADRNLIQIKIGNKNYPPDLESLVKNVQYGPNGQQKIRFL